MLSAVCSTERAAVQTALFKDFAIRFATLVRRAVHWKVARHARATSSAMRVAMAGLCRKGAAA